MLFRSIRNVEAGVPGLDILGECFKAASNVSTSGDTEFAFDAPVFLKAGTAYAIVLITESADYTVHVATVGGTDIVTSAVLKDQAYGPGVLLQSADARAWTPIQNTDLYFKLKCATYSANTKTIEFSAITTDNAVAFRLEPKGMFLPADQIGRAHV